MKIAYIVIRSLMGLFLLSASIPYFFMKMPSPPPGEMKLYMDGISTVHLMTIVKAIELVCGLLFLSGFYNKLAAVVIFPILINIVIFHGTLAPSGIAGGAGLLIGDLFLAYYYRDTYKALFAAK